jgi:hypothetical protein
MKATPKTVKTLLLLFLYYFICTTDVNAYGGEVYFNATDLDGAATIVTVSVYTYDPALKSLVLYGADKTFSFQKYFGGIGYYNGVLDIAGGLYDPDSWFHLPAADEYL